MFARRVVDMNQGPLRPGAHGHPREAGWIVEAVQRMPRGFVTRASSTLRIQRSERRSPQTCLLTLLDSKSYSATRALTDAPARLVPWRLGAWASL